MIAKGLLTQKVLIFSALSDFWEMVSSDTIVVYVIAFIGELIFPPEWIYAALHFIPYGFFLTKVGNSPKVLFMVNLSNPECLFLR